MRAATIVLSVLLPLMCAMPAAQSASSEKPLVIEEITAQQQQIRADLLNPRGRYREMSQSTRSELLERQSRLLQMLAGKASIDGLTEEQRMETLDTLKWIETAIGNAEDERMVCELRRKLGTQRKERVCMTVRQQREMREAARDRLESRSICGDCKTN